MGLRRYRRSGVVGKPELIFLDEPTTGLDPQARREAWDLVDYFRELGATTSQFVHGLTRR